MPSGMAAGSQTGCPGALNAFVNTTESQSMCVRFRIQAIILFFMLMLIFSAVN